MKTFLRRSLLLLLAGLTLTMTQAFAQNSTTLSSVNGNTTVRIEFLGVTDNGNDTYTWRYELEEASGSGELSHWVLALCLDGDLVISSDPALETIGVDNGGTNVDGIKWDTDGGLGGAVTFSFTLSEDVPVASVAVGIKGGGQGSNEEKSGVGTINGPSCICVDASDTPPSWDGNIFNNGDGTAAIFLDAPLGLKTIELGQPTTNLVLQNVRAADGAMDVLADYTGEDPVSGGFNRFVWTGDPGAVPTSVKLIIRAPDQAPSSFFLHFTDCCNQTLRVDPVLELYAAGTAVAADAVPQAFTLGQNYPNPFNPTTSIRFELPEAAAVRLTVYDVMGREVKTLLRGTLQAGVYQAAWDGLNASGQAVSSGLYLYRLEAGSFVQTRRMTLLK